MPRTTTEATTDILNRVSKNQERIVVQRNSKRVAAIVSLRDLAALEKMEDQADSEDLRRAKRQWERSGKSTVSWSKLKSELGL